MGVDIGKLVATIVPDIYCVGKQRAKVKKALKEGIAKGDKMIYIKVANEIAQLVPSEYMDIDEKENWYLGAYHKFAQKNPLEKHWVGYDKPEGSLEGLYFFILDYLRDRGMSTEKLVDTFLASPGSANFAEMGGRMTRMQEEGMKMLGAANQVIKSILNILYDLKEFKIRLQMYDDFKSKDPKVKNWALLSLKQIWMDTVDIKRGNSAIKALAQQFDYVTIIDAFMAAENLEKAGQLDLNDRVKRILIQRVGDFEIWIKESENELRKRYEIEKIYLKSQVNTVRLYARWAKPYLNFAKQLEQNATANSDLVNAFNSTLMQLLAVGIRRYDPLGDIGLGHLPDELKHPEYIDKCQKFWSLTTLDFRYRSFPERIGQGGYGFRGRADIYFYSFALRDDEFKVLKRELERDDFGDIYGAVTGATTESLDLINKEIDDFLDENKKEDKDKNKEEDTNPFSALFSFSGIGGNKDSGGGDKKDKKKGEPDKDGPLRRDNDLEGGLRNQTIVDSRKEVRRAYNVFKKAYNFPGFPN